MSQRPEPKSPKAFSYFMALVFGAIAFTIVHSLVYNWVFLPIHRKAHAVPLFLNNELVAAYWQWFPGKCLLLTNTILLLMVVTAWFRLKRE
jgi:hypothetical protein